MADITYANKDKTATLGTAPRTWRDEDANEVKNVVNNFRASLVAGKVPTSELPDAALKIGSSTDFDGTGIADGFLIYWDQTAGTFKVKAGPGGIADVDINGNTDVFLFDKTNTGGNIELLVGLNDQLAKTVLAAPEGATGTPTFRRLKMADIIDGTQETDKRYFEVVSDVLTLKYILPDIAALQAFVRDTAVIAYVSDPLRGGYFNYVAEVDFVGTADMGISFPAQDGGYWVRRFEGDVELTWYPILGDLVANDSPSLQAACDAGRSVDINGLAIRLASVISLSVSGISIYDSKGTGKLVRTSNGMFFNTNGKDKLTFEKISFEGDTVSEYIVGGINVTGGTDNLKVKNCTFTKTSQCLNLNACNNITLENSTFIETGYGVLQVLGTISNNVFVKNNFIKDYHRDFVECNSASVETANWVIDGNICEGGFGWPTNFQTEGRFVGLTNISNVQITNNIINKTIGDTAIHIEGTCKHANVSGNILDNCVNNSAGQSPYMTLYGLANDNLLLKVVINNNIFKRTDNTLPEVYSYVGGTASRISRTIISGNFIESTGNLNGFSFPLNSFKDLMLTNNKFIGCNIGIFGNSIQNAQFANNYFIGCGTPMSLSLISKSQILDNTFVDTSGSHDISSETLAVSVDNGPNYVVINGNNFSKGIIGRDANFSMVTNNFFPTGSLSEWGIGGNFSPRYGNVYSNNKFEDFKNANENSISRYDQVPKIYSGIGPVDVSGIPLPGGDYIEATTSFNVGDLIQNIFSLSTNKVSGWVCITAGIPGTCVFAKYGFVEKVSAISSLGNRTLSSTDKNFYFRYTGVAGNITIPDSTFLANDEVVGEIEGGAKTILAGAGVTLRYSGSNIVYPNQKFTLKFKSPSDVLLEVNKITKKSGTTSVANRTLAITDDYNYVRYTGLSGNLTVPPNVFSENMEVVGEVEGGAKTFVAGAGVTIRTPTGFDPIVVTNGRFLLKFKSANDCLLTGNLQPTPST